MRIVPGPACRLPALYPLRRRPRIHHAALPAPVRASRHTHAFLTDRSREQRRAGAPRRPDNPWVFPGRARGTGLRHLNASWQVVRKEAGLEDTRVHDFSHYFASRAVALGDAEPFDALVNCCQAIADMANQQD